MGESDILLKISDAVKIFDDHTVINHVNLDLERGKFITFLGPSGCGKTTLLRMIAGFYHLDSGAILLNGKDIAPLPPQKRNTPMVFQEYALFPHMTVHENIAYGLRNRKVPKTEIATRVRSVLELVNLTGLEKRFPNQMSGGQQQRVAIARAMVNNSELLLLDEPLSNLDAKLRESVRVELRMIQQKMKITMLYVTHDQQEALSMSDKILVLNHGTVQQYGTPREIYFSPRTKFVADFIGTTNFISGQNEPVNGAAAFSYCGQKVIGDLNSTETGTITFSIRPESIRLSTQAVPGEVSLPCDVEHSMFLGEKVRYFLRDEADKEWIVDAFDTGTEALRGSVFMTWTAGKPHLVAE
ncbi:spermidine/putrescine ABC transporter ATP-binding subunit [Treponema primitia ZAS-2]|uniref:Spermidine/putrescine ABC transporter ATP-binding subunit n=1 Tax=Treponema primitia (strain ATCC BAA-887 / DSM 12427 / ZAS-2) TaxID=545694 RepID=F5YK27_TREPZ|nr:ABC transporter ATP-binding protein [Treponema primitia]AEF86253.1 spermidine/putrescine ABC transporter ATP-binding subunit [Treponema primitia ZAS-2]